MADILIKNGYILTQDKERTIIEDGAVAIQGDRILEVGKASELEKRHKVLKVINARNKLVMPGLIDSHSHLECYLSRGLLDDILCVPWIVRYFSWYYGLLTDEIYNLAAKLTCLEMIKTGTTCFCDCGTINTLEDAAVRAVEEIGIRGVLGRIMMDIYDPPALEGIPEHLKETTKEALDRGEEFIKKYNGGANGRIQAWLDLQQMPNSSDELCHGTKALAGKYRVGILTHAAVTEPMVRMTEERFGLPDIERCHKVGLLGPNFMAAHMGWVNGKELYLLKQTNSNVAHIPGSSMRGAYGSVIRGRFPEMVSMGINVALGCDGASCGNFYDMVQQLYLAATAHKEVRLDATIMKAQEVLDMATVNGARALLWERDIGSLEAGKKADIAIFDLMRPEWLPVGKVNLVSNLVYSATGDSCDTVIIDGQIVMENRKVLTVNERRLLEQAQETFQEVVRRADWLKKA